MRQLTVYRAADLQAGDRIYALGDITYRHPRVVLNALGPLMTTSAVEGVKVLGSLSAQMLYPSQIDGQAIRVLRPEVAR